MPEVYPIEEWRPVKGYEGIYSVSSHGRVRRDVSVKSSKEGRIIIGGLARGYRRIRLCRNGVDEFWKIHRLVATAFIGEPEPEQQVNHKNGIRDDNRVTNLEWVTQSENIQHAFRELGRKNLQGEHHRRAKLTGKKVLTIRRRHASGERVTCLAKEYGVSQSLVTAIVAMKIWKYDELTLRGGANVSQ